MADAPIEAAAEKWLETTLGMATLEQLQFGNLDSASIRGHLIRTFKAGAKFAYWADTRGTPRPQINPAVVQYTGSRTSG